MNEFQFDIELGTKDLYVFVMRHFYCGISGIFGVLLSIGCLIACALKYDELDSTAKMALIIIGCLFTIVQPVMLFTKAWKQIRRNKNINAKLHYIINEEGICVSQGEQEGSVKWSEVRKKVLGKKAIYIYTSPVRAFIFPREQCGENFETMKKFIADSIKNAASQE